MDTTQVNDVMSSWSSPQVLIGIYAAVLSTFVFLWKLIEKYRENTGNLQVKINIASQYMVGIGGQFGPNLVILSTKITNRGKSTRYIERPFVETDKESAQGKTFTVVNPGEQVHFPYEIGPGQTFAPSYDLKSLRNALIDKTKIKKIRVCIKDTIDKKYNSNWINVQAIKDATN